MKSKRILLLKTMAKLLAVIFIFALAACNKAPDLPPPPSSGPIDGVHSESRDIPQNYVLKIGASTLTGAYYQMAVTCVSLSNEFYTDWLATPIITQGSTDSYQLMLAGEVDTCAPAGLSLAAAWEGTNDWDGKPIKDQLMWTATFPEWWYIMAPASSTANSLSELAGKRVSIGDKGSGAYTTNERLLSHFGIEPKAYFKLSNLSISESLSALQEGSLDAMLFLSGNSSTAMQMAESTAGIKLISLSEDEIATVVEKDVFTVRRMIPAGTFKGIDYDYYTLGDTACMVSLESCNVPEQVVYDFVKVINENNDTLVATNPNFVYATAEETINAYWSVIPFHPGAERYYRELGLIP